MAQHLTLMVMRLFMYTNLVVKEGVASGVQRMTEMDIFVILNHFSVQCVRGGAVPYVRIRNVFK